MCTVLSAAGPLVLGAALLAAVVEGCSSRHSVSSGPSASSSTARGIEGFGRSRLQLKWQRRARGGRSD